MQTKSYADADGIHTFICSQVLGHRNKNLLRHHVSQDYMFTNNWPKVTDSITIPLNLNEPCHEKPVIGDM